MTLSISDTQHKWQSALVTVSIGDSHNKWHSALQCSDIMLSVAFYLLLCWMPLCRVSLCWASLFWLSCFIYYYAECQYAELSLRWMSWRPSHNSNGLCALDMFHDMLNNVWPNEETKTERKIQIFLIQNSTNLLQFRGRIFSRVRPFCKRAVSNLDRPMQRSLWV